MFFYIFNSEINMKNLGKKNIIDSQFYFNNILKNTTKNNF